MYLRSITLKGFKSFPNRTRLEFGPGVSVVVGPNGSGKSNVTDAVLWALGEQSPLAVRGQSMQDVIFAGGHGVQARSGAEVEIVLDNGDGAVGVPLSEISIVRRLERTGESEYRVNGARCRLVDVIEVLSDTGLGKEMHSVISQGRVEAIVTSKPRDRRLLIEEAAGLGKHRKRRRRAQLKLERTQDNLDRALDVEREARSRLRPLKRQAEAAELHERLARQTLEARWELARDAVRARRTELAAAEAAAGEARGARERVERELSAVAERRERAERELGGRGELREALARNAFGARGARERVELRREHAAAAAAGVAEQLERRRAELEALRATTALQHDDDDRVGELEAALAELDREHERKSRDELAELESARAEAEGRGRELAAAVERSRGELEHADRGVEAAREALRVAEREVEGARRAAAGIGAELAAVNEFLGGHAAAAEGARALADELEVEPGYELAVAAALGGRLSAAIVADVAAGAALLDRAGADGARALVSDAGAADAHAGPPPAPGARALAEVVRGPGPAVALARRLLANAWVVEELEQLSPGFAGVAATRAGRVWFGAWGELRQLAAGGGERVLAQRNERARLIAETERAAQAERDALAGAERARAALAETERARDAADGALRTADRARADALERERSAEWLLEQRRTAPEQGAAAIRRAQLDGELAAERRAAQRVEQERAARARRVSLLAAQIERDGPLPALAERLAAALERVGEALAARATAIEAELESGRAAGEGLASELRDCAAQEGEIQRRLRACAETVTEAEVRAQQARDQAAEAQTELGELARALGLAAEPADEPLDEQQAGALAARIERLARRREQLGPVNPLARDEYSEAVAHVEQLEHQRTDLETALRELRSLIRDTDRQIRESFEQTFEAAALNFEEVVGELFPGGRGRLRLVRDDAGPRPVLGGQAAPEENQGDDAAPDGADHGGEVAADSDTGTAGVEPEEQLGVEIEITPAGKSMKRLSLLSGGEKSLTAIAFLFAVFLAKPCPFYILDEVEAALDDVNIGRFLALLRRYSERAQFIVVTHQKRTMEAADCLYGVSMGSDGVSKVISRRLPQEQALEAAAGAA